MRQVDISEVEVCPHASRVHWGAAAEAGGHSLLLMADLCGEQVLRPPRKASSDRSKSLALVFLSCLESSVGGGHFCSRPVGCEFLGPPANVNRPLLIGVHLSVQENAFPSQRTWIDWLEIEFSSCVCTGSEMRKPSQMALASRLCFSGGVQQDSERQERQSCLGGLSLSWSVLRRETGPPSFQSWQQYHGVPSVLASLRILLSVGREEPAGGRKPKRKGSSLGVQPCSKHSPTSHACIASLSPLTFQEEMMA
ncbi:unnamed protein product [Rangifer tarandus platyrhynchus]|uniref:Uncharacterized protein n=1 Tax=Rangifer tarandus platyrhynchus TaxID=3082113 RepID=A0ABN8YTH2_RANTA|nr:unnamed protein product [Rangifer tarandus platyrhynchus]